MLAGGINGWIVDVLRRRRGASDIHFRDGSAIMPPAAAALDGHTQLL